MPEKYEDKDQYLKAARKTAKFKAFKDEKGHEIPFFYAGKFERIIIYCPKCLMSYQLTHKEIEKL